jgi:arylsulfatase
LPRVTRDAKRDGRPLPKAIKGKGELRSQWHHVIDIAPTILEAAGLPEPKTVNVFPDPDRGGEHALQLQRRQSRRPAPDPVFEIFGNRAIYHDGWFAGTVHKAPWELKPRATLENDQWELYNTRTDFSLANDLAKSNRRSSRRCRTCS